MKEELDFRLDNKCAGPNAVKLSRDRGGGQLYIPASSCTDWLDYLNVLLPNFVK